MQLSDIINKSNIVPALKAKDKKGVLEELAESMAHQEPSVEKDSLVKILMEREQLGTTGIGDGVAIPHGKLNTIDRPLVSFGRSKDGLDFDSMDGQPAYLFFLLVAPDNSSGVHLQILAKIAKLLKNSDFREELMVGAGQEELYQTIIRTDEDL
jgi:PTS system nitrogen regulatory IIA component